MIDYAWCTELQEADAQQLSDLLVRAAAYDAEPEYNSLDPAELTAEMADPSAGGRYLVLWLQPRPRALDAPLEPRRVAGLLRFLPAADGWYEGTVIIDPDLRSIGIMTLLMERAGLALDADEGWLGSGIRRVRAWARGNHPASGRIADRNLIPRDRQMWKLIRPVGDDARPADVHPAGGAGAVADFLDSLPADATRVEEMRRARADAAQSGEYPVLAHSGGGELDGVLGLDLAPVFSEEFGRCASVRYLMTRPGDRAAMRDLITAADAPLREAGLDALILYVESSDDDLVAVCRLAGFQHDRTDVRYELH